MCILRIYTCEDASGATEHGAAAKRKREENRINASIFYTYIIYGIYGRYIVYRCSVYRCIIPVLYTV